MIFVFEHCALNPITISDIYLVHVRFSSSADKPGNFARNSCLSNPGIQATSAIGVEITCGVVTTAIFYSSTASFPEPETVGSIVIRCSTSQLQTLSALPIPR